MDLQQYASVFWRRAWLILLCVALGGGSALVASQLTTPVYRASAKLLLNEALLAQTAAYARNPPFERLAMTSIELMTTRAVFGAVIQRLGLELSPDRLAEMVHVQIVRDTQLIEVSVEDTDPQRAARLANLIPEVFGEQNQEFLARSYTASKQSLESELRSLDNQIAQTQAAIDELGTPSSAQEEADLNRLQSELVQYWQSYANLLQRYEAIRLAETQTTNSVVTIEPALPPKGPILPTTLLNTLLGAAVGLMLGVGIVFLIEYRDDSLKSADQVTDLMELSVLGAIAKFPPTNIKNGPIVSTEPYSPVAEAYRALATNIQLSRVDRPLKRLLVTSPGALEGKSTVVANLGLALAQVGVKVILLDCDLRRPTLHKLFSHPNTSGLTDLLLQPTWDRSEVIQATEVAMLGLITTGPLPPNPAELLNSERLTNLLDFLAQQADVVLVDSPPCLPVSDAVVLAAKLDGVLMVFRVGATRLPAATRAVEQLQRTNTILVGAVINWISPSKNYYYYDPYYQYEPNGTARLQSWFKKWKARSTPRESRRPRPPGGAPG